MLSQLRNWNLKFSGMKYKFRAGRSYRLDRHKTIRHVIGRSSRSFQRTDSEMVSMIEDELIKLSTLGPISALCCGYDCVRILARLLVNRLGNTNRFDSNSRVGYLAKILRVAYESAFFRSTACYRQIRQWETRTGYTVLRSDISV